MVNQADIELRSSSRWFGLRNLVIGVSWLVASLSLAPVAQADMVENYNKFSCPARKQVQISFRVNGTKGPVELIWSSSKSSEVRAWKEGTSVGTKYYSTGGRDMYSYTLSAPRRSILHFSRQCV